VVAPETSSYTQSLFSSFAPAIDGDVYSDSMTATGVPKAFNEPSFTFNYNDNGYEEKTTPKRRARKPQKPGYTAKMHERHFVVHNYHDHADDDEDDDSAPGRKGSVSFPAKLHAILDQVAADGLGHILSWQPHGRCFKVHKPTEFVELVMPKYFRQTKLTSFQRQLNLYGFCRLTTGPDTSGYYHELFLRGKPALCNKMARTKVKGTKFKAASSPELEPNFYEMKPVGVDTVYTEASYDSAVPSLSFESTQAPVNLEQETRLTFPAVASIMKTSEDYADRVLDEAVNELFFSEGDSLNDLRSWDLTNDLDENEPIGDAQLGDLLEQLLED
jgi:hypothetical protein